MDKQFSVGLFGYGCAGQGFHHVLKNSVHDNIQIDKVCVKNVNKKRELHADFITFNKNDILINGNQDFVVELTDSAEDGMEIVRSALTSGKDVVSANKKMIAENIEELIELQKSTGSVLLYDAACAGSLPVIRTLEDYYQSEKIRTIRGILNGTSNFILTNMWSGNLTFEDALLKAEKLGFAESDPSLDISGNDTKFKNCIISVHSSGALLRPDTVLTLGINSVSKSAIEFARSINSKIKLLSYIHESEDLFTSFVLPSFISSTDNLYNVDNEYNAVEITGEFTSRQIYIGKGAGGNPTGFAVLADIAGLSQGYQYKYRKLKNDTRTHSGFRIPEYDFEIKVYAGYDDHEDIEGLKFSSISESDELSSKKYVIGNCCLNSIKNLSPEKLSRIFICAFDPIDDLCNDTKI